MGNIIKIPIVNTGLRTDYNSPLWDDWSVTQGLVNGSEYTPVNSLQTETSGDGQGLIVNFFHETGGSFTLENGPNSNTVDYKVGDVVFFTIPAGNPDLQNENEFTISTTLTEDMISYEGDKMQYLPVFDSLAGLIATVVPPSSGNVDGYWQIPKFWGSHSNCWRININGVTNDNRVLITQSINRAFIKAAQKTNSHPTIELPSGVTCSSVDSSDFQIPS